MPSSVETNWANASQKDQSAMRKSSSRDVLPLLAPSISLRGFLVLSLLVLLAVDRPVGTQNVPEVGLRPRWVDGSETVSEIGAALLRIRASAMTDFCTWSKGARQLLEPPLLSRPCWVSDRPTGLIGPDPAPT